MSRPAPGPFEQLQKESRDVFVGHLMFDGGKFDIAKMVTPNFQVTHRYSLGAKDQPQTYTFGSFFAHNKGFLMGEIDPSFNLNGRFAHSISEHVTLKGMTQMNSNGKAIIGEVDVNQDDFSANLKLINLNFFERTGAISASYLQSVTQSLALGVELSAHSGFNNQISSTLAVVGRLSHGNAIMNANLTTNGAVSLSYHQKVNEQISIASEFEAALTGTQRDSFFQTGVKFDLRAATMRAQIDTLGRVTAVLEEKLTPAFSVLLCGEIDHFKSSSRFGVGINVGL